MNSLIELASVVTKHKAKQLVTIDSERGSNAHRLYEKIVSGEISSDEEAANLFFNKPPTYPQYRKLRNKLQNLLWNSVVFIDTNSPKFSDAQKAFYTCQRYLTIARILVGRYAPKAALPLAEKALQYAEQYEIYEVARDASLILRNHHGVRTGDQRKFNRYKAKAKVYDEIVRAENFAQLQSEELSILLINQTKPGEQYFAKATESLIELKGRSKGINSFRYHLFMRRIEVNLCLHQTDYNGLIHASDSALDFFKTKKNAPPHFVSQFRVWKLLAYVALGELNKAKYIYHYCDRQFEDGTVDWYNIQELYLLGLFKALKFRSVLNVFLKTTGRSNFKNQSQKRQETFKNYEALIYYLTLVGKIRSEDVPEFRLRRFLNEIPIFSQDKRGYNISVLVVQFLILLQQRKHDQLTDRIEAIEKYTSRYLRNDENFRSNCFIKMLLQIPKRNFHKVAVLRHAKPYIKRLATVPLEKSKQSYEIEIIPYEHLWEYALESL